MKIGVIMGGLSSEREISLLTGQEMMANLDKDKHEVCPIEINGKRDLIDKTAGLDLALLALHGKYGEDGTVQATLESLGIPYTGSGVLASSVCMDKEMSKKLMRCEGLHTGESVQVSHMEELEAVDVDRLGYPVVVKPNSGGSSIGIQIVEHPGALSAAVQAALEWDDSVMIEQFLAGEEITCSILNGELLPVISIQANAGTFFDYTSKYEDGGADERVIQLPQEVHERVEAAALSCYRALRCSVYARIDMIVKDGIPYILEVNTLPGLTKNSLLPKSAAAANISFPELLELIMKYSLVQRDRKE
ncbi:D-alanine--D-alanine ligase [Paenibacillus terrigena]|uniref:D-alanine--D-alanine ligase n=1 Tax=Paenibacillus terrigena TaxID=369333 RepID=UPI0028D104E2|nr:D-alanine--D-alanine ligase [Paenibacillus terrigena]